MALGAPLLLVDVTENGRHHLQQERWRGGRRVHGVVQLAGRIGP